MPLAAWAADDEVSSATVFTGVEVDNQDSHRLDLGLALEWGRGTRFDLVGSRSEAGAASLDVSSTYAFGQLAHDFGRVGLAAGVRHMRDEDLSKTLGYLGSAFVDISAVRVTASVEARSTDFDDTAFTAPAAGLGLTGVTSASGTTACSVDSLGYGLGLTVVRSKVSFYAAGTAYDYSSYECDATVTSTTTGTTTTPVGASARRPTRVTLPASARQLAANVTSRFGGYSATRVPRAGALLESSVMAGARFALGARHALGVELYRDREEFSRSDTTTALAYLAFPFTRSLSMDFTLGASDSELLDSVVFAGVKLTGSFGH
jgi:hypothetical protein